MNKKRFYLSLILFFSLFTAPTAKAFEGLHVLIGGGLITGLCAGKLIWNRYYKKQLKTLKKIENNQKISFATHEVQGSRPTMEDAHDAQITEKHAYFGLFDGHGSQNLSRYCASHLYNLIIQNKNFNSDIEQALTESFISIHKTYKKKPKRRNNDYGTTAVAILLKDNKITTANAGDSRAVLSCNGIAKRLSFDHKPEEPTERERLLKQNAKTFVQNAGTISIIESVHPITGKFNIKIVPHDIGRITKEGFGYSFISLSRAIGDYKFENLLIPNPAISIHTCTGDEQFIILACDGLWDIIEDQAAVDIVRHQLLKYKHSKKTHEEIGKEICAYLCKLASGNIYKEVNSHDNVTITLILFPAAFK